MVSNQEFLSKGFYQYAQVGNPVLVKDYIFARQEGKKCLLVRFSNELEYTVDAMDFTVIQMDAAGKILENTDIKYTNMGFSAGETYVSTAGIVVNEYCTDFRISFKTVRSGRYEYVPHGGHTAVRYIKQPSVIETRNVVGSHIFRKSVNSRRFGKPRLSVLLATVAILMVLATNALSIGWEYYDLKRTEAEEAARAAEEASRAAAEESARAEEEASKTEAEEIPGTAVYEAEPNIEEP